MRQVPWNKKVLEKFISEAFLTDFEELVLRTRIEKSWPRKRQARELNCSMATLDRTIRRLKDRYDEIQQLYPDDLPKRKKSEYEEYLDNN